MHSKSPAHRLKGAVSRLPEQPIFYPVMNEEYAIQIARDWNVRDSGAGYVTRFEVEEKFLLRYPVRRVGGSHHTEPAPGRNSLKSQRSPTAVYLHLSLPSEWF